METKDLIIGGIAAAAIGGIAYLIFGGSKEETTSSTPVPTPVQPPVPQQPPAEAESTKRARKAFDALYRQLPHRDYDPKWGESGGYHRPLAHQVFDDPTDAAGSGFSTTTPDGRRVIVAVTDTDVYVIFDRYTDGDLLVYNHVSKARDEAGAVNGNFDMELILIASAQFINT